MKGETIDRIFVWFIIIITVIFMVAVVVKLWPAK